MIDGGYDIEGELRPSAVYESPIGPKRFRIVDPTAVTSLIESSDLEREYAALRVRAARRPIDRRT